MDKNLPLSFVELSRKNLIHNLETFRGVVKEGTKIAVAIKGNAYGHGQNEIAKIAEDFVDYFIVNSFEELKKLREVSSKPTFVLGYVSPSALCEIVSLGCILSVFSESQFFEIEKVVKKMKVVQEVHIACDSLLGREGFLEKDLVDFFALAKKSAHVKITGIYSHFANIEDTNNFTHAKKQIDAYKRAQEIAKGFGFSDIQTHISATSGLLVYEKNSGINSIVRVGIGMYGLWPSEYLEYKNKKIKLRPVLSWKTHVAQVKKLGAGSTVGYGLTYMTKRATKIALIPQGYADGFSRLLSNKGRVIIDGKKCQVLGRVSMNMFVVDVTRVSNINEGDEVVLIGAQGKQKITAEEVGGLSSTINYEVTTRISPLLPRVVG